MVHSTTYKSHTHAFSSLAVNLLVLGITMPIMRSVEVILIEMDEVNDEITDECMRLQTKRRKHPSLKKQKDALMRVFASVNALVSKYDNRGNCIARQMAKHIADNVLRVAHEALLRASRY